MSQEQLDHYKDCWGIDIPAKLVLNSGEMAEVVREKFRACAM